MSQRKSQHSVAPLLSVATLYILGVIGGFVYVIHDKTPSPYAQSIKKQAAKP